MNFFAQIDSCRSSFADIFNDGDDALLRVPGHGCVYVSGHVHAHDRAYARACVHTHDRAYAHDGVHAPLHAHALPPYPHADTPYHLSLIHI